MINFPTNPISGETYTVNNKQFTYNGVGFVPAVLSYTGSSTIFDTDIISGNRNGVLTEWDYSTLKNDILSGATITGEFLPLSGGTLTGSLSGTSISATTFYGDGSNLTGVVSTHNALSGLQGGESGQYYHLNQAEYSLVSGNSLDNRYVNVTGDTLTGQLKAPSFSAVTYYGDGSNLTGVINDHNDLTNIQGGLTDERYHLNISEYSAVSGNSLILKAMQFVGICKRCNFQPTDITINSTANTITISTVNGVAISESNPLRYFTDGNGIVVEHLQTVTATTTFTNTTGVWYVHFDTNSNFVCTQVPWSDFDLIATVYRFYLNATKSDAEKIVVRAYEGHLNVMSAEVHAVLHAQGTVHLNGFDLVHNVLPINATGVPTLAPNADGRNVVISLTSGRNSDDGLEYNVNHSTSPILPFSQNLGEQSSITLNATNSGLFKIRTNDINGVLNFLPATRFPFAFNVSNNVPQYITSSGVRTDVADNQWFVYYAYALQDDKPGEPIKLVSAEQSFTTYALAQSHDWINLQALYATLRDKEIRPLYKLIFYCNSAQGGSYDVSTKYSALVSYVDIRTYRTQNVNASSSSSSVLASNVIVTPPSGFVSIDQQSFDNEIATKHNTHVGSTGATNPHLTSFNNLISTAHTHTISDVNNLQTTLDAKLNLTGGTITGTLSANTITAVNYSGITTSKVLNVSNLSGNTVTDVFNSAVATEATDIFNNDVIAGCRIENIGGVDTPVNKYWEWDVFKSNLTLSNHNDTLNIQGGESGEYYHLSQAEYALTTGNSSTFVCTTWAEAQSILGDPNCKDNICIHFANTVYGTTLQTYAKNIILTGAKIILQSDANLWISGLEAGTYNIYIDCLIESGAAGMPAYIKLGESTYTTTVNLKLKQVSGLSTATIPTIELLKIGTGNTVSITYNELVGVSLINTSINPTQEDTFYALQTEVTRVRVSNGGSASNNNFVGSLRSNWGLDNITVKWVSGGGANMEARPMLQISGSTYDYIAPAGPLRSNALTHVFNNYMSQPTFYDTTGSSNKFEYITDNYTSTSKTIVMAMTDSANSVYDVIIKQKRNL